MWSLHKWLVSKLALPDDDEVMVKRKKILIWFFIIPLLLGATGIFVTSVTSGQIASYVSAGTNIMALVWLFVNKKPSDTFIELVGYADLVAIIFTDLNSMGSMIPRLWALTVIVIDVMLVCRIRSRSSIIILAILCLWLIITSTEDATRFGLLDIGDGGFNGDHDTRLEKVCGCDNMPCSRKASSVGLTFFVMMTIFLLDFYFTRGFAEEVLAEKRKLELGVLAARDVASFLAGFKLEEADAHLDLSKEDLPERLHEALHTILVNLRSYKPYLPQSCLRVGDSDSSDEESTHSHTASHTQSESHTAHSTSVMSDVSTASKMMHVLAPARATMLVMNMKNSIAAAEVDHVEFSRLHAKVIGFALHAVRAQKGMLDLFVGDHVHASFNASKRCMQHAVAAVKTATTLKQARLEKGVELNVAACSGKVLVGDLGNNEVRRFSIMGNAAVLASVYERLGAEWGIGVVCNTTAYMDASVTLEMRIVLKAITLVKHSHSKEVVLWEALGDGEPGFLTPPASPTVNPPSAAAAVNGIEPAPTSITSLRRIREQQQQGHLDQEWMYALDESRTKHWVKYNEAAKLYLQGECFGERGAKNEALDLLETYTNEPVADSLADLIRKKTPIVRRQQVY